MSVDERLAELGITLPDAPAPAAVYRPAVKSGNLIIVSGQVATRDGAIMTPGRLGDAVSLEDGYAAARQWMDALPRMQNSAYRVQTFQPATTWPMGWKSRA